MNPLEENFEDSNWYSESVNRSRIYNTMAKRKRTKGQTMIYKTKDRVTRTQLKTGGEPKYYGKVAVVLI